MKLNDFKERELATKIKKVEKNFETYLPETNMQFIRLDGRAFKTFCKGFEKPFDKIFRTTMERTMIALCEELSGSIIGFTQSDEITIMFCKKNEESEIIFKGRIQKIASTFAAIATLKFNQFYMEEVQLAKDKELISLCSEMENYQVAKDTVMKKYEKYEKKFFQATFDCRVFSVQKEDAREIFIWRVLDCYKNAVQMIARTQFSNAQLKNKNLSDMKEMLKEKNIFIEEQINRNMYGICTIKEEKVLYQGTDRECIRNKFTLKDSLDIILDENSEIFK